MEISFTQCVRHSKKAFFKQLLIVCLSLFVCITANSQQYTENFSSSPAFTPDPNTPAWTQTASVTLGRVVYDFITGGNGGWEYKAAGGSGNSASLLYSTAATTTVTIKRRDGKRFQFYGAWLSYTNFAGTYTPPWLKVTYEGSMLASLTYASNSTVTLSQNINVTSVSLYFSGLQNLNFDNVIVGPATPIPPISKTDQVVTFTETTATLSGSVTDDGGSAVTESGLVYGTSSLPTGADNKLALSNGVNSFSRQVSDLQNNTTYYVRSYAINSTGTAYGNEESFTTFGSFTGNGSHNFNTNWAGSANQNSPFTKFIEGWDVTGASSGTGVISIYRLTDADAAEGASSLRVAADNYAESLTYLSMSTHNLSLFNLQSFVFRYDAQQIGEGASYGRITVTGYKNGTAVPGATQDVTGISPLSDAPSYHTFTASPNIFTGINEFRLTVSNPVNGARLYGFDLDEIVMSSNVTLPVMFTSVKAYRKNEGVQVEWQVGTESDVDHYEVEKSGNGINFTKAGMVSPKANNYLSASYNWYDLAAGIGNSYYRIRSVYKTGSVLYSEIMKISIGVEKGNVTVYPNPVVGNSINLKLNNLPKGNYSVQLVDISGHQLMNVIIDYPGGSLTETLKPGNKISKGIYQLKVSNGVSVSYVQKLVKE